VITPYNDLHHPVISNQINFYPSMEPEVELALKKKSVGENKLLSAFPAYFRVEDVLFTDEVLLWTNKIDFQKRLFTTKPIAVLLLLAASFIAELSIAVDYANHAKWGAVAFSIWLPFPIQLFCFFTLYNALGGVKVDLITNYRVMEVVIRRNHVSSISLSFPCISGTYTCPTSIEFIIENAHLTKDGLVNVDEHSNKRLSKRITFDFVPDIYVLERIVHEQRDTSSFVRPTSIHATAASSSPIMMENSANLAPAPLSPASTAYNEIFLDESTLPKSYLRIFDRHNDISEDSHGEPPQGYPLNITRPNKYKALFSRSYAVIALWVWLTILLVLPKILANEYDSRLFQPAVIGVWIAAPLIMSAFVVIFSAESHPVDVLTSKRILLFRTGLQASPTNANRCSWGARMRWYSYRHAYPLLSEVDLGSGKGDITLTNVETGHVKLARGPAAVERQEIIYRNHMQAISKEDKFGSSKI